MCSEAINIFLHCIYFESIVLDKNIICQNLTDMTDSLDMIGPGMQANEPCEALFHWFFEVVTMVNHPINNNVR